MKRMMALLLLVVVAGALFILLMLQTPERPLQARSKFHFASFTNIGGTSMALFNISNHPGYLNLHAANVYRPVLGGWTNEVRTNISMGSFGGMTLGVPMREAASAASARVVFEIQEDDDNFMRSINEWLADHMKFVPPLPRRQRTTFWVTSEIVQALEPAIKPTRLTP